MADFGSVRPARQMWNTQARFYPPGDSLNGISMVFMIRSVSVSNGSRSDQLHQALVDYVPINPVKHGLVEDLNDWPYSSWHRYQKNWPEDGALRFATLTHRKTECTRLAPTSAPA